MSVETLGTSGYAEGFIGEERCERWIGLGGMTTDCWLSLSESSRSRLFEAGLAAGTSRFPAVVRSVSKSLAKLVSVYDGTKSEKLTHRSRPAMDHRVSAVSSIKMHFRTSCISFTGSSVVPVLLAPHKLRRRTTAEANAGNCANTNLDMNKCVESDKRECTHDNSWRSAERVLLPQCIRNVTICTSGARADCERSER